MPRPPAHRRRRNPFDRQVLGLRLRPQVPHAADLKVTPYRAQLMRGIAQREVKAGQGSFKGQWRWAGVTVTHHVARLISADWAQVAGKHVELTDAGSKALEAAE